MPQSATAYMKTPMIPEGVVFQVRLIFTLSEERKPARERVKLAVMGAGLIGKRFHNEDPLTLRIRQFAKKGTQTLKVVEAVKQAAATGRMIDVH